MMCASNNEFGANRLAVTRSRRRDVARRFPLPTAAILMLRLLRCTAQSCRQLSPYTSRHLIVKGMMRSLANVHCEPLVPPPNGVVLFKDVS
jgi:hypothetical protein